MIITIARQCGSGGLLVGDALKKIYGIPLYNVDSLKQLAQERGVAEQTHEFLEEEPADSLTMAIGQEEDENPAGERMRKTMQKLIGAADCIVIGRCGNYIFGDRKDCVSVFLKGDSQKRCDFMAKYKGISSADARELVQTTDERRRAYHSFYTRQQWGDASFYDLCLDSNRLGFEKTAALIENYVNAIRKEEGF